MRVAKAAQSKVKHIVSKVETGAGLRLLQKVLTILPTMCQVASLCSRSLHRNLSSTLQRLLALATPPTISFTSKNCAALGEKEDTILVCSMYTIPHRDARTSYCNWDLDPMEMLYPPSTCVSCILESLYIACTHFLLLMPTIVLLKLE